MLSRESTSQREQSSSNVRLKLYLDSDTIQSVARENQQRYSNNLPFPHIVLDGLFPDEALDLVLEDFPSPESKEWKRYQNNSERKLETQGEGKVSANISWVLYQLNSAPFLHFLETLTGIDNLIPDPYFAGGGLHQIQRGGKLGIHTDPHNYKRFGLDRRVNIIIYLNKDWMEEFGGCLELWDKDVSRCVQKILPIYNRLVVFSSTDWTYHGHPEPLNCPDDITRKSIALYYYTNGRPEGELNEGNRASRFVHRPGEAQGPNSSRKNCRLNDLVSASEDPGEIAKRAWSDLLAKRESLIYGVEDSERMSADFELDAYTWIANERGAEEARTGGKGVTVVATNCDPQIMLPLLSSRTSGRTMKVQMSSPCETFFQVFYQTATEPFYLEERSIRVETGVGDNDIYILLPSECSGRLRMDPGCAPGAYRIKSLEIRA